MQHCMLFFNAYYSIYFLYLKKRKDLFLAFMVNSLMYIPNITTLITQDYPGDSETSFSAVTAWGKILNVSTILLIFEI